MASLLLNGLKKAKLIRAFTMPIGVFTANNSLLCLHYVLFSKIRLVRYGQCFVKENFTSATEDEFSPPKPRITLWDRTTIWKNFPELSYTEFMESEGGLLLWLEMFHRYGVALLRGVPTTRVIARPTSYSLEFHSVSLQGEIVDVVKRFAYVKETSYGVTFDVVAEPDPEHLAFTGAHLHHHTGVG